MNKFLSMTTVLSALSATAAPYYTAVPAGGELTPYDMQPVYTLEALYSAGENKGDPDMWGMRGSFNLYSNAFDTIRHQFNLNIAPEWGTMNTEHEDADCFLMPLTAGYDLNLEIAEDVFFYMGGKAGYGWMQLDTHHGNQDGGGFSWSVGAGLKFQCSKDVYVKAGYEFGRTHFSHGDLNGNIGTHTFSLGVGCTF